MMYKRQMKITLQRRGKELEENGAEVPEKNKLLATDYLIQCSKHKGPH